MEKFFYPHNCVISRDIGNSYADGDSIIEVLYTGICGYHPKGSASLVGGISFISAPNVILPVNHVVFNINDIVEITANKGRKITATIETLEDNDDDDCGGTTLYLKNAV
ncbi:MAG: hypothetical protein RR459_03265 [Christensenellaceae bacterium]